MTRTPILIIGGGLTGLTLQYLLKKEGLSSLILEGRDRTGGRIFTITEENGTTLEMGATWFGPAHERLQALLEELGLQRRTQYLGKEAIYEPNSMTPHQLVQLPGSQQPSWRIKGGTTALIRRLQEINGRDQIITGARVIRITAKDDHLLVETESDIFKAGKVVSTLPPKLLQDSIEIQPALPEQVDHIMSGTHTWMGESIKFAFSYDEAFWLHEGNSGTVFSNVGPVNEMYDHSRDSSGQHALKGFLNSSFFSFNKEQRREKVLEQLRKYYGDQADSYRHYYDTVWSEEKYTYRPYDQHVLPHQHNGHQVYHKPYLDGRLFIAGAETSEVSPGYMDGAVYSAEQVANTILNS